MRKWTNVRSPAARLPRSARPSLHGVRVARPLVARPLVTRPLVTRLLVTRLLVTRLLVTRLLVISLLGTGLLVQCQPEYPIAPTACDDWCLATQRAGCEEDYPERCVSSCEDDFRFVRARCEAEWLSLLECYQHAPDDGFWCVEEQSRPQPICIPERVALAACGSVEAGSCVASCLRQADECGRPRRNCEFECLFTTPGCAEPAIALHECRLASPVDCVRPGEPDPRPPEQIPCFGEALVLLDCADPAPEPRAPLP